MILLVLGGLYLLVVGFDSLLAAIRRKEPNMINIECGGENHMVANVLFSLFLILMAILSISSPITFNYPRIVECSFIVIISVGTMAVLAMVFRR